jgi:hypothetical protein
MLQLLANLCKDITDEQNQKQKSWRLLLLEILCLLFRNDSPQSIIEGFYSQTSSGSSNETPKPSNDLNNPTNASSETPGLSKDDDDDLVFVQPSEDSQSLPIKQSPAKPPQKKGSSALAAAMEAEKRKKSQATRASTFLRRAGTIIVQEKGGVSHIIP